MYGLFLFTKMSKYRCGILMLVTMCFIALVGCANTENIDYPTEIIEITDSEQKNISETNFLGGRGTLVGNTYNDRLIYDCAIEDNENYYYAGYVIPKKGEDNAYRLCDLPDCKHTEKDCKTYMMINQLSYCDEIGYYYEDDEVFLISSDGEKKFLGKFSKDKFGENNPEYVGINAIIHGDWNWIYIDMPWGSSRLYNTLDGREIFIDAYHVVLFKDYCVYTGAEGKVHCLIYETEEDSIVYDEKVYMIRGEQNKVYFSDSGKIYSYSKELGIEIVLECENKESIVLLQDVVNGSVIYIVNDYDLLYDKSNLIECHLYNGITDEIIDFLPENTFQRCGNVYLWCTFGYEEKLQETVIYQIFTFDYEKRILKQYEVYKK